jgi:hypothetical protein
MDVSSTYINIPLHQLEETINKSLKDLGKFVGADRTYVFEYDWENGICNNTFEWCEEGVSPQIDELQALPIETIKIWAGIHKEGKSINIPDSFRTTRNFKFISLTHDGWKRMYRFCWV